MPLNLVANLCMIWFHLDCIMQLKWSYHIATNVCSRKSATTFGDLPDDMNDMGKIDLVCLGAKKRVKYRQRFTYFHKFKKGKITNIFSWANWIEARELENIRLLTYPGDRSHLWPHTWHSATDHCLNWSSLNCVHFYEKVEISCWPEFIAVYRVAICNTACCSSSPYRFVLCVIVI